MKNLTCLLLILMLTGCYKQLELEGFDQAQWEAHYQGCTTYRMDIADHLVANQEVLLEATQNEIESLLGKAKEHELYERNQKFFHYRLTPPDHCGFYEAHTYLSIRFNALGRANLVQIMLREPSS